MPPFQGRVCKVELPRYLNKKRDVEKGFHPKVIEYCRICYVNSLSYKLRKCVECTITEY